MKKISISNYKDIQHVDIPLDGSYLPSNVEELSHCYKHNEELVNVSFIMHSNYKASLNQLNTLMVLIGSLKLDKPIPGIFGEETTTITMEFSNEQKNYKYQLKLNNKGIAKEVLFIDGYLEFNSLNKIYTTPEIPKLYPEFFRKIFIIDLNRDDIVKEGCKNTIAYCCNDENYLKHVNTLMSYLHVTSKPLITEERNTQKCMFIYDDMEETYQDVTEVNRNIQEILCLTSILFPCLTFPSIIFICGFGGISFVDKMKLIKFFNHVSLTGYKSQLIGIDTIESDVYESSICAVGNASIDKDAESGQFIFYKE